MNDAAAEKVVPVGMTAGRLLREARQAQGLHIAALASAIKVAPRKLELLESDRFDELPDATFTRALAQTVCRSLKIDAAPVLALLPGRQGSRLGQGSDGLNAPFRERPGRPEPSDWSNLARPAIWGPLLLLLAAAGVYLIPHRWLGAGSTQSRAAGDLAAAAPSAAMPAAAAVASGVAQADPPVAAASDVAGTTAAAAPASEASGAAAANAESASADAASPTFASTTVTNPTAAAPSAAPGLLQLHVSAQSWVEVIDARGQSLLSRLIQPGESVDLDGAPPLKVKIGNAAATEVVFRGQSVELASHTRDNLARLELK
ncbi:MAG: helix-turn-helix domain-containing protein [Caldimonas sp.]